MSAANGTLIMRGLLACVQTRLPTYLDAVEAALGVALTDPEEYILGRRDVHSSDRLPTVRFMVISGTPEMAAQAAWAFNPLTAEIILALKESTPEALNTSVNAHADALLNLIAAHRDLDGACDQVEIENVDWWDGPPASGDIGGVVLVVNIYNEIRT
ncbi:MAG: hypothetical protein EHM91_14605 [Planctomycetota bacterium]|nr:MAG: hypothetical protein EHM91_14605 [Planctomycetota bacterium]